MFYLTENIFYTHLKSNVPIKPNNTPKGHLEWPGRLRHFNGQDLECILSLYKEGSQTIEAPGAPGAAHPFAPFPGSGPVCTAVCTAVTMCYGLFNHLHVRWQLNSFGFIIVLVKTTS